MSTVKKTSALDEMNHILEEKKAAIDEKLSELRKERHSLEEFKSELTSITNEIKVKQKALDEREQMLNDREEKIKEYEHNFEEQMEKILEEKVKLEEQSKEQFLKELEIDADEDLKTEDFNLNELRASIGLTLEDGVLEEEKENKEATMPVQEVLPSLYGELQQELIRQFKSQKVYVLEETPLCLCMQLGNKEFRVFANGIDKNNSNPVLHLVINHKNAKRDSKLQQKIAMLSRVIPDWEFVAEANQLVCVYYYDNEKDAKTLISKLKECIKNLEE